MARQGLDTAQAAAGGILQFNQAERRAAFQFIELELRSDHIALRLQDDGHVNLPQ